MDPAAVAAAAGSAGMVADGAAGAGAVADTARAPHIDWSQRQRIHAAVRRANHLVGHSVVDPILHHGHTPARCGHQQVRGSAMRTVCVVPGLVGAAIVHSTAAAAIAGTAAGAVVCSAARKT